MKFYSLNSLLVLLLHMEFTVVVHSGRGYFNQGLFHTAIFRVIAFLIRDLRIDITRSLSLNRKLSRRIYSDLCVFLLLKTSQTLILQSPGASGDGTN